MARQHLARDLGVARLVGADQSEGCQPPEKEEGAERQKNQPVEDAEA